MSSCKNQNGHNVISVSNKSSKTIVITSILNLDTLECINDIRKIRFSNPVEIESKQSYNDYMHSYNENWESRFNYEKWYVYFFDIDTFYNFPCDTFKKYKWYEKRELTLDYLNKNNWTITYP
jgi:hypothetical protein